jgi:RNA polymerase sigma-70 factor (ECF subfamily)
MLSTFLDFMLPNALAGLAPQSGETLVHAGALSMDNEAFAAFYHRSARPLWAYLARVSADPSLADDLVQETYIRFLGAERAPAADQGEVAQRRYLFRIATNLLRDHWRKPRATSLEDVPESFFAAPDFARAIASHHEAQALLAPALARLSPRERQLLWLAHAEGYSHREIAEIMGLASASIRLLLFRARRRMAALLRQPTPSPQAHPSARSVPAASQASPRRQP